MLVTVGHGTLPEDDFSALLLEAGVEVLIDVRAHPGSRHNPQFGRDRLATWLPIPYRWEPRLGGRRRGRPGSPHVALRNDAFRAYADHMEGDEFRSALAYALAEPARSAVICSESVWWRCHRRLIADAATLLHGVEVRHLMHDSRLTEHAPTEGVRVDGDRLVYDVGVERPLL